MSEGESDAESVVDRLAEGSIDVETIIDSATDSPSVVERAVERAPVGVTIADAREPDNPLVYVNDAFERITGYPREEVLGTNCRFLQGEESDPGKVRAMREAIAAGHGVTVELRNYRKGGEPFWNRVEIAPLFDGEDELTHFVGFQSDVTARKEAEAEVERRVEEVSREREALSYLLDRVSGLLGDVTGILVRATEREDVERAVCERLTASDAYATAWIGERDARTGAIDPRAWSGSEKPDGVDDPDHPVARALTDGERLFLERADPEFSAPDGSFSSLAVVPLVHADLEHGVLVLYDDEEGTFDDREAVIVESIGRALAGTLSAAANARVLAADNVIELEFVLADDALPFVALSTEADCRLQYEGSVPGTDGTQSLFFTVEGIPPERVLAFARDRDDLEATLQTEQDETSLVEFRVASPSIVEALADRGARTLSIEIAGGEATITVETVPGSPRSIAAWLTGAYDRADLVAYHERERPPRTREEHRDTLEERLTDRQLMALQRAFLSGYYDANRTTSGDDIAASMGIGRSTFHQHLRAAERKLVSEFLDR
ncbi:bacterio-opsin activator domain-containing protein [Natronorarus salvus]|uniref:bacterio-opsin activator domain-containing protein n=1 Tax=Natronorarus salvus TaxID=3117733 RepID=UPI002F265B55